MLLSLPLLVWLTSRTKSVQWTYNMYMSLFVFARTDFVLEVNPSSKRRLSNISHTYTHAHPHPHALTGSLCCPMNIDIEGYLFGVECA